MAVVLLRCTTGNGQTFKCRGKRGHVTYPNLFSPACYPSKPFPVITYLSLYKTYVTHDLTAPNLIGLRVMDRVMINF